MIGEPAEQGDVSAIGEPGEQGDVSVIGEPAEQGDVSVMGERGKQGDVSAIGEPAEHPSPEGQKFQLCNTCSTIFGFFFFKFGIWLRILGLTSLSTLSSRLVCQNEACKSDGLRVVCGPV
jgi:hypothetical protein